jgi:hypothetical protein
MRHMHKLSFQPDPLVVVWLKTAYTLAVGIDAGKWKQKGSMTARSTISVSRDVAWNISESSHVSEQACILHHPEPRASVRLGEAASDPPFGLLLNHLRLHYARMGQPESPSHVFPDAKDRVQKRRLL